MHLFWSCERKWTCATTRKLKCGFENSETNVSSRDELKYANWGVDVELCLFAHIKAFSWSLWAQLPAELSVLIKGCCYVSTLLLTLSQPGPRPDPGLEARCCSLSHSQFLSHSSSLFPASTSLSPYPCSPFCLRPSHFLLHLSLFPVHHTAAIVPSTLALCGSWALGGRRGDPCSIPLRRQRKSGFSIRTPDDGCERFSSGRSRPVPWTSPLLLI